MTLFGWYTLWSFRRELFYVGLAFLIILSLPVVAVFLLTHAGIDVVSDKLAEVHPETHTVEIHNPDGSTHAEIKPSIIWPIKGRITQEFGSSIVPFYLFHTGIDIAAKKGTPVAAAMTGTVTYAGETWGGFGKHVIIDHGNHVSSLYGHLDKIYVYKGQKVDIGYVIGAEGTTGLSTGPHLHFQINVFGIPVNPRKFLN